MIKNAMFVSIFSLATIFSSSQALAAPAICNNVQVTTFSKEECTTRAEQSIRDSGFSENIHVYPDPGIVFGVKNDYSAIIRCVPDSNVVFFVVAGPTCTPETGAGYRNELEKNF